MARQIRHIEIYLPLTYNDGAPIAYGEFQQLETQLLARFGGVTSTRRQFPLRGIWQSEGIVYQDRVVIFGVMDFSTRSELATLQYFTRLKTRLTKQFDQLEILITIHELTAV